MSATSATGAKSFAPADLAYVAVFAALISVLAQLNVTFGPVPFTLQTLGVALTGLCLGPWRAGAAVALYVLVGAAGLPVFAQGKAGLAVLLGPTGGYLLSFILAAVLIGFAAKFALRRGLTAVTPVWLLLGCVAARYLIIFPIGVAWLANALGQGFAATVALDMPFWLWDLLKNLVAVGIALAVHKAFPRLLGR